MGFDVTALFAGVSSGVAESIETRNKQIRSGAVKQLDQLVSEAEAKEKGLRTERDVLSQQARQLATFRGANGIGLTQDQILGLIQQPETAKSLIEELKNKKDLSDVDMSTVFKVAKPGTQMPPEEYIAKKTSIVKPEAGVPSQPVRGAFGFTSPAVGQAETEFEAVYGRKASDVRAIAQGKPDLGADFKPMAGVIDLKQFGNPESLSTVQNQLRDSIANGEPLNTDQNKKRLAKLRADATIKTMFEGDGEGGKPRSTAAINSVIDKSLRAGLDPFVVKGVVRFDPQANDYVPITGDTKAIADFMDHKNKLIQSQAKALGILDKDNKIVGGRNASDALLPYANIEDGKVVSWKSAVTPKPAEAEAPAPAGPKVGAPSAVTASTETDISVPAPAILTEDGKGVNRQAMQKTYKAGQKITLPNGQVKTWNGITLQ